MFLTLHPTGALPVSFEADKEFTKELAVGPKRRVCAQLFTMKTKLLGFCICLSYLTEWDEEYPNVVVLKGRDLNKLCEQANEMAPQLLPPGAGYPGTPEYAGRQAKLRDQVGFAAITALTECLAEHHRAERP